MVLPSEDDPGVLAVKASLALDPPDLAGKSEKEAREALLARCKAVLREQHIAMHGRPKKTRDEMLVELEAHPLFLAFQDEVHKLPKLRASTAVKVLKGVDPLISKEYKQALLESMQRRARTKHDVIEAVRQEALRKLTHEEDVLFNEEGSNTDFSLGELQERLDEAQKAKSAHGMEELAAQKNERPAPRAPRALPTLPAPARPTKPAAADAKALPVHRQLVLPPAEARAKLEEMQRLMSESPPTATPPPASAVRAAAHPIALASPLPPTTGAFADADVPSTWTVSINGQHITVDKAPRAPPVAAPPLATGVTEGAAALVAVPSACGVSATASSSIAGGVPYVYAPYTRRASPRVSAYWVERYEREAALNWDRFYRRHADHFFKDRHYLADEWPELRAGDDGVDAKGGRLEDASGDDDGAEAQAGGDVGVVDDLLRHVVSDHAAASHASLSGAPARREQWLLEAGCGVGNTLFPLVRSNPCLKAFGFDCSPAAIDIIHRHTLTVQGRVVAAVGDLTSGELPIELAECAGKCDAATLMFVLSAISPDKFGAAIDAAAAGLAEGGVLLIRDYAEGDGAQHRLRTAPRPKQLDDAGRFFVRQDGTRAYYFAPGELPALVQGRGCFETLRCDVRERTTVNKAKGLSIARKFVQATFRKVAPGTAVRTVAPAAPSASNSESAASTADTHAACHPHDTHSTPKGNASIPQPEAAATDTSMVPPPCEPSAQEWEGTKRHVRDALDARIGGTLTPRMLRELLAEYESSGTETERPRLVP